MSERAATSPGVGASSILTVRSAGSMPRSRASSLGQRAMLAGEAPAPHHDVQAEAGRAPDHLLTDAADAEQAERLARTAPAPSRTPSCSTCRRAAPRRCRASRRSSARISAKASSATAMAFLPGTVRDVDAARRRGRRRRWCCSRRRRARRATAGPASSIGAVTFVLAHDEHVRADVARIASVKRVVLEVGLDRRPRSRRPSGRRSRSARTCRRLGLSSASAVTTLVTCMSRSPCSCLIVPMSRVP